MKDVPKARALLDKAKLRNPKSAALWVALVRLEHRNGNEALVQMNLAKGVPGRGGSGGRGSSLKSTVLQQFWTIKTNVDEDMQACAGSACLLRRGLPAHF